MRRGGFTLKLAFMVGIYFWVVFVHFYMTQLPGTYFVISSFLKLQLFIHEMSFNISLDGESEIFLQMEGFTKNNSINGVNHRFIRIMLYFTNCSNFETWM